MDQSQVEDHYDLDLVSLVELGKLEKTIHWCGHEFVIRTLSVREELAISRLIAEWKDTVGVAQAGAAGLVAASLVSINGIPFFPSLTPDHNNEEATLRTKFHTVGEWVPSVVQYLSERVYELTSEAVAVVQRVEKKYARKTPDSANTSTSQNDRDSFGEVE